MSMAGGSAGLMTGSSSRKLPDRRRAAGDGGEDAVAVELDLGGVVGVVGIDADPAPTVLSHPDEVLLDWPAALSGIAKRENQDRGGRLPRVRGAGDLLEAAAVGRER